jgi:hypothetical protein
VNAVNDLEITSLVKRLGRPHPSGGIVVERVAILAAGADYTAVMDWILDHAGTPETVAPAARTGGGLHGSRISDGHNPVARQPSRFVLPAGSLD